MRWSWPAALAAASSTCVCVIGGLVLAAAQHSAMSWLIAAVGGTVAVMTVLLGCLVTRRAVGNVVGPLLALTGLALAFTAARLDAWRFLGAHQRTAQSLDWLVALLAESSIWLLVVLCLLLLYFPDGRLPGPRWRLVPGVLVAAGVVHHAYGIVDPAPYAAPLGDLEHAFAAPPLAIDLVATTGEVTLLVLLIASAVGAVLKYRRADEPGRRQMRWLAVAGVGVPGYVLTCLAEIALTGHSGWVSVVVITATLTGIPVSVAVAMLRNDLYDVDRALTTGIAYVALTAALGAVFVAAALVTGGITGRGQAWVAATVTALALLALAPLRRRVQGLVDRRWYPRRRSALAAIAALEDGIHRGTARPEELVTRLRAGLRDPGLRVGYLAAPGSSLVDEAGERFDAPGMSQVPVVSGGTRIGVVASADPALSQALLVEVAAASATLVDLVRVRLELRAALRDVELSRSRLVQVGDEERRRLQRDLHDGAQQRLVSLGMSMLLAQRHLDDGTVDVSGVIDLGLAELGTAVAELRQIAHGLRPSTLDDGLHTALRSMTRNVPVPVAIDIHPDPLPDDVVTTAYYVASEAIANAVKHAAASQIDVSLARREDSVEIRITDDGRGGASLDDGSGLAGLDDRLRALGGSLLVESGVGRGTVVRAVMPCAS